MERKVKKENIWSYIYGAGYLGRKVYEEYRSLRMEDDKCLGFVDAYKKE